MISQTTITSVFSAADIIEIIGSQVKLKKVGANYSGLCPFHDEKSPSFTVSPAKSIYKCFGCGKAGNAISFVMETEKKTYPEAIVYLAEKYNIPVEEDKTAASIPQETKDKKQQMQALLQWAARKYEEALYQPEGQEALQYLYARGYTDEKIKMWSLGFAPYNTKFLTSDIISKGQHSIAVELGLINTTEGVSRDFLIKRITVPIQNQNGILIGFAGRIYTEADKKYPKWINPKNSLLYNKSQTWYGLSTAKPSLTKEKMLYIVEGYPDVHTMQDNDITNTVAPCGKEIAPEQILFLKKYTDHVCFIPNIDENESGQKAVIKHIDSFIAAGFKTSVIHLPECNDADEYIRNLSQITVSAHD